TRRKAPARRIIEVSRLKSFPRKSRRNHHMAKSQTSKTTIGNDPFDLLIPVAIEPATTANRDAVSPQQEFPHVAVPVRQFRRQKLTVHLRPDLVDRVKNAAYWNPRLTITSIAEMGIIRAIESIEQENGGPYPTREENLRGGRPMK